jgi:CRP-like cAMP-binding protein
MAESSRGLVIAKRSFPANTVLCHQGEICDQIYLLLKGSIRVLADERVIQLVDEPGSFVGELTPFFKQPRSTTLVTADSSECLEIPAAYLENLLIQSPEEDINLLGVFAERLLRKTDAFRRLEEELQYTGPAEGSESPQGGPGELRAVVLVASTDAMLDPLNYHLRPLGYHVTHVSDPLRVIDGLDTSTPDMIVFNAVDFPRQWKPMLSLLRERKTQEESVFVLITNPDFRFEEAAKAAYLNVNGIIPIDLLADRIMSRLQQLLRRYKSIQDRRKSPRLIPNEGERFEMIFTHPKRLAIVAGQITDISLDGSRFVPDDIALVEDMQIGERIRDCSLRIGGKIVTVDCRLVRRERDLGLEFESFGGDGDQLLFQYLIDRPVRDLRRTMQAGRQAGAAQ